MSGRMRLRGLKVGIIPVGMTFCFMLWCGIVNAGIGNTHGLPDPGGIASWSGEGPLFEGKADRRSIEKGKDPTTEAVADAVRSALLEAVRPLVHPVLFAREKDFLLKVLAASKDEMLEGAAIVAEEACESGDLKVTVRVRVREDIVKEVLLAGLNRRVVLTFSGTADGKALGGYGSGRALSSSLWRKGYKVTDLRGLSDEKTRSLMAALRAGDRETAGPVFAYLLAGSFVEGRASASFSEKTGDIYSSRAEGNLRIMKPGREQVILAVRGVKGFGSNERKAGLSAVEKADQALALRAGKYYSGRQKTK